MKKKIVMALEILRREMERSLAENDGIRLIPVATAIGILMGDALSDVLFSHCTCGGLPRGDENACHACKIAHAIPQEWME